MPKTELTKGPKILLKLGYPFVLVQMLIQNSGLMNLGGSLMRQMERDLAMEGPSPHIVNIGKLVEEHENKIRNTLNEIYFSKSKDIVNGLRNAIETLVVCSRCFELSY